VITPADLEARAEHPQWWYGSRVSQRWNYVAFTSGKVGCSTIKYALHELEGKPPVEGWWTIHDGDDEMSMSRLGFDTIARMINDPAVVKFCMVRNPYDRIFSAWKSKILRRMDTQYQDLRDRIRDDYGYAPGSDESPRATLAFGDFVRWIASHADDDAVAKDGHWNRQVDNLWWGLFDFDVVGRFENFADDFGAILRRLGAPDAVVARGSEKFNETTPSPLSAAFDSALAGVVYDFYRADFDAFGYAEDSWQRYDALNPVGL
jgi:hypothetical protein